MQEPPVNKIVSLLLKLQADSLTVDEQIELDNWIGASEANKRFATKCQDRERLAQSLASMEQVDAEQAWKRFIEKNGPAYVAAVPMRRGRWAWLAAAVVVGGLVTGAIWYFGGNSSKPPEIAIKPDKGEHILPLAQKASITLSDGRKIMLDEKQDGLLAKEGGAFISKSSGGVEYKPEQGSVGGADSPVGYNTAETPRGSLLSITLPDRTKVWLNAAASLRYPTAFRGSERRVVLTGEAYFEVAKDVRKPFIVEAEGALVKVLGTHFDVRSYTGEATIKATLLEGNVEVASAKNKEAQVLRPGEQGSVDKMKGGLVVAPVAVEAVVAWKNGYFDFETASLDEIMEELKRWYSDIESVDIQTSSKERFTAIIGRNVPLSTVFAILEATGKVEFEVIGKRVIVKD